MTAYTIAPGDTAQRKVVEDALVALDLVPADLREKIVTAWTTSWLGSSFQSLADMPYAPIAPDYPLFDHVNDVTRAGLKLARQAQEDWNESYDLQTLLPILILHDVDKPLIYVRNSQGADLSELGRELPHGVVGAMLLKDLGFSHDVVSTVALHASDAPFHANTFYGYVLHYADMFASDHVMRHCRLKPFYMRK